MSRNQALKSESSSPESCFLPGTNIQYAWDSTSLEKIKRCPRLYYYEMICGWSSKDESVHLRFGIEYHAALQNYALERAANIPHDDAVHDVIRETLVRTADWDVDRDTRAGAIKNRQSLVRTVVWYLDQFRDDAARTLILSDGKPAVEQSFRFELDYGPAGVEVPYLLSGHLDRIVSLNDDHYVMDHKTSSRSLGPWYFDQWEPHNQMTLYSLASKVVLSAPVRGVIIDAVYLPKPNKDGEVYPSFARGFTHRNPDQLDEWLADLRTWLDLAERCAAADYWPQNDTACDKYGGCRFREVCSKSPAVRDRFLEGGFTQLPPDERWNPLKAR